MKTRQLVRDLREAVLSGRFPAGHRLPASRAYAKELGVARGTVQMAYEQLTDEGYLVARVGAGTFVADLPLAEPRIDPPETPVALPERPEPAFRVDVEPALPFMPGLAPIDALPRDELARLAAQAFRTLPVETFGYGDAAGYRPLRVELAAHLHTTRGVACTPDQIVLTSGAQQAIWLCAHVLANAGDAVWLEDPGYRGARTTFERSRLRLIPVPVDEEGIDVDAGLAAAPRARLAYVTPSHQYPMGVPLAVSRRLQLLDWAEQTKAWIIEDDYDSEYRYGAPLLPSLFSLDGGRRVLYIGSLSKVLAPALRLGYLVVPAALAGPIRDAKAVLDRQGPTIMQAVLAQFMESGGYSRHLNRMRRIGNRRWQVMMDGLLPLANAGLLHVAGSPAGLHHTVQYQPGVDDRMVHEQARRHGLYLPPLSGYGIVNRPGGSVLGFAAYPDANLRAGLATLQTILEKQAGT